MRIGDKMIDACIDTGAARSCIALELVEKIKDIKWIGNEGHCKLYSAEGTRLNVEGMVKVPVHVN